MLSSRVNVFSQPYCVHATAFLALCILEWHEALLAAVGVSATARISPGLVLGGNFIRGVFVVPARAY